MDYTNELKKVPISEWAKIWCSLNSWDWPEQLKELKPDWWDGVQSKLLMERKSEIITPLMFHIENNIGDKATSREWNRDRMTDEQHEKWWSLRGDFDAQFEYSKEIHKYDQ